MPNLEHRLTVSSTPEPGQVVEVRGLRLVVSQLESSLTPTTSLPSAGSASQHLITLTSIEDDALGEEVQVIWELEPGARVAEGASLPEKIDGFDMPSRLDAFLDAVRWGSVNSADVRALQAPFRSGVDIEDYQLDPVVRALQMPRANLLIADDVGLGKTIEAGLVLQEMIIRHRARRALIVCPASLQIHWQEQMRDKFGLEFRIVDSALMKSLRRTRGLHVNPWNHFPRLITSMDFLKRDRPMRLFNETVPSSSESSYPRRYDLLIVDEAHNVAPSGSGKYAVDSLRTRAIRMLTPHFEHRLFLTATPHNGYPESFTALLEMIDNQRFARGVRPDEEQKALVVVRRLKSELPNDFDGKPRFPKRDVRPLQVEYSLEERNAHKLLQEYARLRLARTRPAPNAPLQQSESVDIPTATERTAVEFVLKLLKKRLFSSPAAFAITLAQHRRWLTDEESPRESIQKTMPLNQLRALIDAAEERDDDEGEETEDGAGGESVSDALKVTSRAWRKPTPEETAILDQLTSWAERARNSPDSKAQMLTEWLEEVVKPKGEWSDERVILFTEYRATQVWLLQMLANAGLTGDERVKMLYGGMQSDERERVKAAFQAHPSESPVRILLATDAASEGIDLQRNCHRVVHIEIPWNPNRLEQRNGRIDRHGQKYRPEIYHFVGNRLEDVQGDQGGSGNDLDADLEFLWRVVNKVEQIREDLGSVSPVIAEQVTSAMLGGARRLDTIEAEKIAERGRRQLKFERDLWKQIAEMREQLDESRRFLQLQPENIEAVVHTALELAGQPPLKRAKMADATAVYEVPPMGGSWALASEGLAHPFTGMPRPITFDPAIARGRDDVVLAHLNHPLVRMSTQLLRAEVWSPQSHRKLRRVTARIVPAEYLAHASVICHARLVVVGGDSQRLHEEIVTAGGFLVEGRFRRMNVGDIDRALAEVTERMPAGDLLDRFTGLWESVRLPLLDALGARETARVESLEKRLDERQQREETNIRSVLSELEAAIRNELGNDAIEQLELWPVIEREQLKRNREALSLRLAQIPDEMEQEVAQIAARYAKRTAKLFPVAVTFLVPDTLVRQ